MLDICSPVENTLQTLLETLPVELLLEIIKACPNPTLAQVAQTCRWLHDLVVTIMYRDIHITYSHRGALILRTLLQSPHLAKHVRSYCRAGAVSSCQCSNSFAKDLGYTVPELQFRALHHASNLTSLEVRVAFTSPRFGDAVRRVAFLVDGSVKLCRLALHPVSDDLATMNLWFNMVKAILKAQPLLEELALPAKKARRTTEDLLDPDDLPRLHTLVAGAKETFRAILPGRPNITALGFHNMTLAQVKLEVLPLIPHPDQITEITWRSMGETPNMSTLVDAFPSLRSLRLRYTDSAFELFMTQVRFHHMPGDWLLIL